MAGVFLLLRTSVRQSPRLANHPEIAWWLSTVFAAVAGFIAGWAVAAKTVFSVGGFDAEYVITRDYGISFHLLDYLILTPAVLLAAVGAGVMGTHSAWRTAFLGLTALVTMTAIFSVLVSTDWYGAARENVAYPGAAVLAIAGLVVVARMLSYRRGDQPGGTSNIHFAENEDRRLVGE
jgi:hypothetical protein